MIPAIERRACGGLALSLASVDLLCRAAGSLWLERWRTLVVADLHLEKGSSYAAHGQLLPPFDTADTLTRLEVEAEVLGPDTIVLLGDTLHDGEAEARLNSVDTGRIAALARGRTLLWITGNHDADGPRGLPGECAAALALSGLTLTHEPAPAPAPGEIAGHLHPCARVKGAGRRRCFVTDGQRLILPAFGAYAGGLNVRDPAIAGLLGRSKLAVVLGQDRVHPIAWRTLRAD